MANDITNSNSFTESNMKPDSGEIIDAVWGQKIAENTGYVYYEPKLLCSFTAGLEQENTISGTFWTKKLPSFTNITGTFFGTMSTAPSIPYNNLWIDGTLVASQTSTGVSNLAVNWDATYQTDGVDFPIQWQMADSSAAVWGAMTVSLWGTSV